MTDMATTENDLWSNFDSDWLGDAADIAPLLTWILMHADSHIHTHEQLILYHTAQAQHWHKLKRASQRHIAQHHTVTPPSAAHTAAASPLSPLSTNLLQLTPLSSASPAHALKRAKPPTASQLRSRFTAVHSARTAAGPGKENAGGGDVEAVVRRVKAAVGGGGSGVKGEGGSASKGVKFAEQAVVIGQGHVPVNDKATKKQLLREKDRLQEPVTGSTEAHDEEEPVGSVLLKSAELSTDTQHPEHNAAKAEEETKEQPAETAVDDQLHIVTPVRKQPNTAKTRSPELVLPSLSALLQSVDEDDTLTFNLHIHGTPTAATALSPSSSPLPPPPPPPSPAVAQPPPPSRLSPFLQFHPSLRDHPYHQTLAAYQSLAPSPASAAVVVPPVPASAPSLPPRKKSDAAAAADGSVVRFRVDSEMEAPLTIVTTPATARVAATKGSSAPLSPAPSTPHSASSLVSPPPLPPRRPALPTSLPSLAPRSNAASSSSSAAASAAAGVGSGAFRYVVPGQLPVPGGAQPKHRRQRSRSVDLTSSRR